MTNKPVVNGRASICTWELEFYFRTEDQIRKFIKLLMEEEIIFEFQFENGWDSETDSHLYHIYIKGSWADNLVRVAQLAKEVDYTYE